MVKKKASRYSIGVELIQHKGAFVSTTVGSKKYDAYLLGIEQEYSYDAGFVPVGYEHRPDLISNVFYGTPGYWWLLMQVNGITDPFEGFNAGDRILIPKMT